MCYNPSVSIKAFIVGLIGVIGLIFLTSNRYKIENKRLILFFTFVAFVQLADYLIWIDKDCKKRI
jgi:hypothetical protein